jgi:MerR family transcriptional regulator/heat shock protein HspR
MADQYLHEQFAEDEPCYVISVAAKLLGMHQQTLRYYERVGIIEPSRSRGNIRLYSQADINHLREVQKLIADFGVNLAGADFIIRMRHRIRQLEHEVSQLHTELETYRNPAARRRLESGQT